MNSDDLRQKRDELIARMAVLDAKAISFVERTALLEKRRAAREAGDDAGHPVTGEARGIDHDEDALDKEEEAVERERDALEEQIAVLDEALGLTAP